MVRLDRWGDGRGKSRICFSDGRNLSLCYPIVLRIEVTG